LTKGPGNKRFDSLLHTGEGQTEFVLGNEAIVRGALEAGVAFACGYPGTPSSEVTDSFARLSKRTEIEFEYSVNEKVALEMAFAASLAGARSIVAMKHLGLMYAGDPLATIPYIGAVGGLVIVSAGDPSCLTSPNEQDQRLIAPMLHIPMLDPGTGQEALAMTRFAFELSEESCLPVILRPMTRLCHTRSEVVFGRVRAPVRGSFTRDPKRYVPIPANARQLRQEIDERIAVATQSIADSGFCRASGSGDTVVIASGVPAATTRDVLEEFGTGEPVRLICLGAVFPLPDVWLVEQLRAAKRVVIVEELLPFVEDAVHALCSRNRIQPEILGKHTGHFPSRFEYEPSVIQRGLHDAAGLCAAPEPAKPSEATPARPPVLCPSCPHRSAFFAAREALGPEPVFMNDIGCYTLGYGPPLESADALLSMGAGFTLASGVARMSGKRTVGFMGDGTFFHSGMPALVNAINHDDNMIAVILDNQVTAMTGFQDSPGIDTGHGRVTRRVEIETIVRGLGASSVETVDPDDLPQAIAAFERAGDTEGLAVIITKRACPVFESRVLHGALPATPAQSPDAGKVSTYRIDHDRCQHCGREQLGHRCSQSTTREYERAMARARALELGGSGPPTAVAACATACPLFLCIQGYTAHIAGGQYDKAFELIQDGLPLPDSVCRVCHKPCEDVCVRGDIDAPVAINDLKRFVVDWARDHPGNVAPPVPEDEHGRRVAIVGAGPSGLAAAHSLRLRGYAVTLFDANKEPGGLLLSGIPRYRLPLDALRRDTQRILDLGVEFRGNTWLGKDVFLESLVDEFDAVFLAIGQHRGLRIELPGDPPPVSDALSYLSSESGPKADRVLVIGGGNSAIDAARTARRRGAKKVVIACLEDRDEMPAIRDEVAEAVCEGITIHTRTRVADCDRDRVVLVSVQPTKRGSLDPGDFIEVAGSQHTVSCDLVVLAVGQVAELEGLGDTIPGIDDAATVAVDAELRTRHPKVFAGGDVAQGEATVTGAIADGLRAAWSIDRTLRGASAADHRPPPPRPGSVVRERRRQAQRCDQRPRALSPELDARSRTRGYGEVFGTLSEAQARAEAERCMICGSCGNCRACVDLFGCPAFVLEHGVLEIDEHLCVSCGVCAQFCPNGAIVPVFAGAKHTGGVR